LFMRKHITPTRTYSHPLTFRLPTSGVRAMVLKPGADPRAVAPFPASYVLGRTKCSLRAPASRPALTHEASQDEHQVGRALREPAHEVRIPLPAERHIDPDPVSLPAEPHLEVPP